MGCQLPKLDFLLFLIVFFLLRVNLWDENGTSLAINHRLTIWHTRKVMEFSNSTRVILLKIAFLYSVPEWNWITRLDSAKTITLSVLVQSLSWAAAFECLLDVIHQFLRWPAYAAGRRVAMVNLFVGFRADPYFRSFGPAKISTKKNRLWLLTKLTAAILKKFSFIH